jgi:hypothetical protein
LSSTIKLQFGKSYCPLITLSLFTGKTSSLFLNTRMDTLVIFL